VSPAAKTSCPDCGGRGWNPWGTDEVPCDSCDGEGQVSPQKATAIEKASGVQEPPA
jgi:DnaJ-class molecular chaperone